MSVLLFEELSSLVAVVFPCSASRRCCFLLSSARSAVLPSWYHLACKKRFLFGHVGISDSMKAMATLAARSRIATTSSSFLFLVVLRRSSLFLYLFLSLRTFLLGKHRVDVMLTLINARGFVV